MFLIPAQIKVWYALQCIHPQKTLHAGVSIIFRGEKLVRGQLNVEGGAEENSPHMVRGNSNRYLPAPPPILLLHRFTYLSFTHIAEMIQAITSQMFYF